MTLPDLSRLAALEPARVRALGARLRELGVSRSALAPFAAVGERLHPALRAPLRKWHLRRAQSPLRTAMRMFAFMDPVPRQAAEACLGDARLLGDLLAAGLLLEDEAGIVCPLLLNVVNETYVFCDDLVHGGDAVMGAGATTAGLIQAAWPARDLERVLDLGCGAGTAALLLSSRAREAVGADVNPRALILSRMNALLNGIENVRFVEGDLFEPVRDERFDLIVSQLPFVSLPSERAPVTFLHGGAHGDELVLRMLRALPPHLAPAGRAVLLVDWPRYDAVEPAARIREQLGPGAHDLLMLRSPPKDLDDYVVYYAAAARPALGPDYERAALEHREHIARVGIEDIRAMLIVIRATEQAPWTHCVETRRFNEVEPTGIQIERLLVARDLLAADPSRLLASRLVVPDGTRFLEQEPGRVRVELPDSRLLSPVECGKAAADLLSIVHQSATAGDAVRALAERFRMGDGEVPRIVEGIRSALEGGLLEVPPEALPR